ncbi:alaserpin-like isoform X3 [Athalia rosae]|uniref:alaserpin-like isoform X3 n=1 Tax=Athalia rosae TaxID=37344 RepID=UPI0020348565|nr:alaserpin-like isoform X3 [Athalia rosae]
MRTFVLFSLVALAICAKTMAEEGEVTPLQTIAQTTYGFGCDFLKTVAKTNNGNLITSPLSAQVILAMTYFGAGGNTATQMRSSLHMPVDDQRSQNGFKELITTLNNVNSVTLHLANKMFVRDGFTVAPAFKAITANHFLSECQSLNFADSAASAGTINAWCEEKTNNRIKDVIKPDSLTSDTAMVLVNAVYFKGEWDRKFNVENTQDRPFHVDEHTTKNVPTMYIKHNFRYGNIPDLDAKFLEIPYKGKEMSMVIILPNTINGLSQVTERLGSVDMPQLLKRSWASPVEVYLPKFKFETSLDLKETLEQMGMVDMFSNAANFSGISDIPLKVSKVIQKAFIEVNEEGSEAAAVTGLQFFEMSARPPPLKISIDEPFHFTIYRRSDNILLFSGTVLDPTLLSNEK